MNPLRFLLLLSYVRLRRLIGVKAKAAGQQETLAESVTLTSQSWFYVDLLVCLFHPIGTPVEEARCHATEARLQGDDRMGKGDDSMGVLGVRGFFPCLSAWWMISCRGHSYTR